MRHCINCNLTLPAETNYCPYCGQAQSVKRIDGRYIISEIGSILNFKKGFFYTVRELLLRPGITIQRFINTDELVQASFFML